MIIDPSLNVKGLKIPINLCFDPNRLASYLKTIDKWSTLEYEIAAGIAYLKVYKKIVPGKYVIYFVPKNESFFNLSVNTIDIKDIGNFIRKMTLRDTLTDVCLIRPQAGVQAGVVPLQIKRFGLGSQQMGNTNEAISFLKKCSLVSPSSNRLIIVLERFGKLKPQELVDWLNSNQFPFPEVILIYIHNDLKMEFFQLKPNNGTFSTETLSKEQVVGE
jgi:hypothetical protein